MQKQTVKKISGLALGSSMLLLSMIPAASAFAATAPTLTLTANQGIVAQAGSNLTFTASGMGLSAGEEYQFWVEQPNGTWTVGQNYSTSSTFTLKNAQTGNYLVEAYAMTPAQLKANDWSAAVASNNGESVGAFVGSTVTATVVDAYGNPATDVQQGSALTVKATSTGVFNPMYQFWIQYPDGTWHQSGGYTSNATYTFAAPQSGSYKVVAYAKSPLGLSDPQAALMSNEATPVAYGAPAAVQLKPASSSLVADGKATDTITATVVDANGNTVSDFNGQAKVILPYADGQWVGGSNNSGNDWVYVDFTNGVGTATLTAGSTTGTATITSADLTASNGSSVPLNPIYGSTDLTLVAPVAQSLAVSFGTANVSAGGTAQVQVQTMDQAGNPIAANQMVTLTLSGPDTTNAATFANGTQTFTTYISQGTATATVNAQPGVAGSVTVNASAGSLTGSGTLPVVINTNPGGITLSSSSGTYTTSGLPFEVYTVQLVDTNGNVITNPAAGTNAFTVSDNAGNLGGSIKYYAYDAATGQPTGAVLGTDSATLTSLAQNGAVTFVAVPSGGYSGAATVTISDANSVVAKTFTQSASLSETPGSAYSLSLNDGSASLAGVTTTNTANQYAVPGTTVNYTAQLLDANGQAVDQSGVAVTFTATGATFSNGTASYVAYTNSQGQATVSLPISSAQTAAVDVSASFTGAVAPASGTPNAIDLTMQSNLTDVATQVAFAAASEPANNAETVGSTDSTLYAQAENGVQASVSTDKILYTSSNPNVIALGSTPGASAVETSGVAPTVTPEGVGTASITATDISVVGEPSTTYTVSVGQGPLSTVSIYNGTTDLSQLTTSTAQTLAPGAVLPVTVNMTDAAGDIVPADGTYTVALPSTINGQPVSWRLNSTSGPSAGSSVTFNLGQTGQTLYLVNDSASSTGTISLDGTTLTGFTVTYVGHSIAAGNGTQSGATITNTGSATAATYASSSAGVVSIPLTVSDSTPAALAGQTVYYSVTANASNAGVSLSDSGTAAEAVTNSSGQVTLYVTLPAGWASGDSVSISVNAGGGAAGGTFGSDAATGTVTVSY